MRKTAVFGAVLVVAACGGGAGLGESPPVSSTSSTMVPTTEGLTPTTVTTVTPTVVEEIEFAPQDLAEGWVFETFDLPIPVGVDPAAQIHESVRRLVVGTNGMLAFGDFWMPDQMRSLSVIWHSKDGSQWNEVGAEQFANAEIHDIAVGDDLFVAVGNACSVDDPETCLADPAVWTSADGREWVRVPHDPTVFPGCTGLGGYEVNEYLQGMLDECPNGSRPTLDRVSSTSNGFLATGMDPTWSMLWHSPDGLVWNRVDSAERPQFEMVGDTGWWISTDHVGAWTDIGLLQHGQRCIDIVEGDEFRSECFGFIWASEEGESWSTLDIAEEALVEWTPVAIVNGEEGVVVFGFRSDPCTWCAMDVEQEFSIVALLTEDGTGWSKADIPSADAGMVREGFTVVTPHGYVVMAEEEDEPRLAAMWHSEDGKAWTLVPDIGPQPEGLLISSLGWDGDQLILFGSALEDDARQLVLGRWTAAIRP